MAHHLFFALATLRYGKAGCQRRIAVIVYRARSTWVALLSRRLLPGYPRISYEMIPEKMLLTETRGRPSWPPGRSRRGETAC